MDTTLIKNAKLVATGEVADVEIRDGVITAVGGSLPVAEGATVVDAEGGLLMPGLFDMNVHLREPGREDKESITTGSAAALHGGVTGMLAMPNTDPPIDTGGMVQSVKDLAARKSSVDLLTAGTLTKGREGKEMSAIAAMAAEGVRMLTDDPSPLEDAQLLRRCMEYAREFGVRVTSHCSTPALVKDGAMNEGPVAYSLGLPGMPALAEELCVFRDIELARMTGCKLHIQHVSTARSVQLIRRAKSEGLDVTCEASLHHMIFTDEAVIGYGTCYKVDPPLRSESDRAALVAAVVDGTIDVIVSDHAPHTDFEKTVDFSSAPFGVSALDWVLPVVNDRLVESGAMGWDVILRAYVQKPREILGLEVPAIEVGQRANLVWFDPNADQHVTRDGFRSLGLNSPFVGETLRGQVRGVWLDSRYTAF
ncbi:dihydroorotase [Sulfuriroseicoccus oceanibius]|uniref:Dihydroorotase n=1 Tax=Sulfuriroseicoccus oceanibius TaxID=2707525 RepID=A0A6B3L6B0_9BACT|nr:dihydroorotase [Sulfuriroseicoccus oceanibius]QQL44646.1 dihydroorotase [Sulfuriroseicoccus oceanibius]